MDINFASLDEYVTNHSDLDASDFSALRVGTHSCRLVALDAAAYGQKRLIDAGDPQNIRYPTSPNILEKPHNFYQLYFALEKNGKSLGDLSIQIERDKKEAWVSAWDAVHQTGVAMGNMPLPENNVLEALGSYIAQHPEFLKAFSATPVNTVSSATSLNTAITEPDGVERK